jgi:hypothetical protein
MGWRGRRNAAVVRRAQQFDQVGQWTPTAGDVEHRSHEKSHHVMQESIGFDLEYQSATPVTPPGLLHLTPVMITGRRGSKHGETAKAMIAREVRGCSIQSRPLQGLLERELVWSAERGACLCIRSDVIAVAATHRTVPGVKLPPHRHRRRHPDVGGEHRIQSSPQLLNILPPVGYPNADGLAPCMDARVGPAGSKCGDRRAAESLQCLFQYPLNGALLRLALPPAESGAVIVQHELHGALGHCWKTTSTHERVKQSRCRRSTEND